MDFKSFVRAQDPGAKAIPNAPHFSDPGLSNQVSTNGPARVRTPFGQREAGRHLQAYGGANDAIDWVMDCVKLIIETASGAEYHFEKNGQKFVKQRALDAPPEIKEAPLMLTKLFEEPNPYMDYEELIELTLIDYLLVGNAYWLKWRTNDAGQPLALYRMAPPFIKVVPGKFGIESYEYHVPGNDPLFLPASEVMHFRQANPHSPYIGLGAIQGGSRMLDLELALTDTQASYYEKRAQPSMVVQSDRRIPKDVFKRLQIQLRQMYSGPRNAGALMVLESGLKYQSISPTAADAMFQQLTTLSRDRILAMFRVPGELLGINDATTAAGSTSAAQRVFDTKTMRPMLNKFQKSISRNVVQAWGMDFKIEYDYIMPVEDRIRLTSSFAAIPGVRVREVREYAGLDALGDENDDIILNLPGTDATALNTSAGHPDNNLTAEKGRPPNPQNTQAFPKAGQALPATAAAVRPKSLAAAAKKAVSMEDVLQKLDEVLEAKAMEPARLDLASRVQRPDDILLEDREAAVDEVVADMSSDILKAIHNLERGLLDEIENAVEGKAPGDRIRSKIRASEAWKTFMAALSVIMEKAAKKALSTAVIQQGRLGNQPEDEIDYDALARELVYRTGGVRKISANLKNEVAQKVGKALAEGQTRADLELAIREAMDFWRETHAETVALTEATHAYNEGIITVAELTGHTHLFVHDGREHDQPCIDADGQIWDIETAREHRLEHPRCRRAFTPVTPSEVG